MFTEAFVNALNVPVELYDVDGSVGAAKAGGIGAGIYASSKEAFHHFTPIQTIEPTVSKKYDELYQDWLQSLQKFFGGRNKKKCRTVIRRGGTYMWQV